MARARPSSRSSTRSIDGVTAKKKAPAPKWTAKPRPVEEAGRGQLHHFERQGDEAIGAVYVKRTAANGEARKGALLVSLGALEVLIFVRAAERGEVDQATAKAIAARLRKVLDGSTWNEAFDAPWMRDPSATTRAIAKEWKLYEAFEDELVALRKRRTRATKEEARQIVAAKHHVSEATVRAAVDGIVKATRLVINALPKGSAAKTPHEDN